MELRTRQTFSVNAYAKYSSLIHEWLPVSQTDRFQSSAVSAEDLKAMRTPVGERQGANPEWTHGGTGFDDSPQWALLIW